MLRDKAHRSCGVGAAEIARGSSTIRFSGDNRGCWPRIGRDLHDHPGFDESNMCAILKVSVPDRPSSSGGLVAPQRAQEATSGLQLMFPTTAPASTVPWPEKHGVVYTKRWVVDLMLDLAGYTAGASRRRGLPHARDEGHPNEGESSGGRFDLPPVHCCPARPCLHLPSQRAAVSVARAGTNEDVRVRFVNLSYW